MKKCPNCGRELESGLAECPDCGHKISAHRFLKEEPVPKSRAWIWILAVVLVAAVAAGGFFALKTFSAPEETLPPVTQAPTTEATQPPTTEAPTTEATTEPTEPPVLYRNPFNGTPLEEPYTGRPFALTISNTPEVLPHVNVTKADIIFESFVNGSIVRMLGIYSDLASVDRVGPIRSTRLMFNDLADHYSFVIAHAGGSGQVLSNARDRGLDHFNIDQWVAVDFGASIRDPERSKKIDYVSSFLAIGPKVVEFAGTNGIAITGDPEKDYLLRWNDDGTPEDGETAEHIEVTITYNKYFKPTILDYNPETGKYEYSQYGKPMLDWDTEEPEAYRNVIVLLTEITTNGIYQVTEFTDGGEGYFACGGKLIPITWGCDGDQEPLWFRTLDGQELELGVGNTYIAITQPQSSLTWGPAAVEEPESQE